MSNGSLDRHLGSEVREALPWKKRIEICIGAARGLHYLHAGLKRTIIHHDIKPRKILLDDNMHPKLSGFSSSLLGAHFKEKPKPIKTDFADKLDVYAFGTTLLEVVGVRRIFERVYFGIEKELLKKCIEENIDQKIKGEIAPECWQVFIEIALRCINKEPDERPAMGEVEGEVEVELELALLLQEQADITNTDSDYTLLSKTVIIPKSEGGFEYVIGMKEQETVYSDSEDMLHR